MDVGKEVRVALRIKQICEQMARLKHGPKGTGQRGPCESDCLKCELEVELRQLRLAVTR